jgi:lipoprotein NlpI
MQDIEHALALDPNNASAYYHRGVILAKLRNYSSAIQDYDRALDLEPDYANAYIGRGIAYADPG